MGKVARRGVLIAGAGGVAVSTAKLLSGAGDRVLLVDVDSERVKAADSNCADAGLPISTLVADMNDPDQAQMIVERLVERYGDLQVLVTTFNIWNGGSFLTLDPEAWDSIINPTLRPLFLVCQAAARHMSQQQYGRIINVISRDWIGQQERADYATAQAGIVGMTRTIALELVGQGITANLVAVGLIDDERTGSFSPEFLETQLKTQPMNRLAGPAEIAHAVAFMAADESSYMTGQILYVDGGRSVLSSLTV